MIRKRVEWKFRGSSLTLGERTLVVGILNLTPDSFSGGGIYDDADRAVKRAIEIQELGADLIDIGAESTRPGSARISEAEELRRLIPVLKRLKGKLDIPISVDTFKPPVAEAALDHGAAIINDVSGLVWEPDLARTVRDADAGLILSHTRGRPEEWARLSPMRDVMGEIAADLEASLHRARRAGIELDHIVIDPGIGFGKRKEQNSELLARLSELRRLLLPVLVGPSRKSFLNQEDPLRLEFATAAAVTAAILNGAALVRVHDVAAMKAVAGTVDAIVAAAPDREEESRARRSARDLVREREQQDTERKKPIRPPLTGGPKRQPEPAPPPPPMRKDTQGERPAYSRPPYKRDDDRADRRDPYRGKEDDRRPPFRGRPEGERPAAGGGRKRDDGRRPPPRDQRGDESRPRFRSRSEDDRRRPPTEGRDDRRPPPRGRNDEGGRPGFRGKGDDRPPGGGRPPSRWPGPRGGGGRGPSTPRRRG